MSGEFELIADYFAPLAGPGGLGLRDDAALFSPRPGCQVVATADALVAGVHFFAEDPPELIARKALRVNLSDLAAMGAQPLGYLLTAAWPAPPQAEWIASFTAGLAADQKEFRVPLLGGDTTATPGPLTLSVTALGDVAAGRSLRRDQARPGETIYLSGTLGDGALGLAVQSDGGGLGGLDEPNREHLIGRYRLPQPRLALGRLLSERGLARAAIDLSDGLAADLGHVLAASAAAGEVHCDRLPLSAAARAAVALEPESLSKILSGGDDYELLFTASPEQAKAISALADELALPLTPIGEIAPGQGLTLLDSNGKSIELDRVGWSHF
ncbi:MAG: thiamine-phosphate kinase [Pseudomonadota bacterium]